MSWHRLRPLAAWCSSRDASRLFLDAPRASADHSHPSPSRASCQGAIFATPDAAWDPQVRKGGERGGAAARHRALSGFCDFPSGEGRSQRQPRKQLIPAEEQALSYLLLHPEPHSHLSFPGHAATSRRHVPDFGAPQPSPLDPEQRGENRTPPPPPLLREGSKLAFVCAFSVSCFGTPR